MASKRIQQIGEQIRDFVSTMLVTGRVSDPRVKFVSISSVVVSADLQNAKIYYSVLGDEKSKVETQKGLTAASPYLRRELAQVLQIRYTPELRFYFDESLEKGAKINEILNKIKNEEPSDDM